MHLAPVHTGLESWPLFQLSVLQPTPPSPFPPAQTPPSWGSLIPTPQHPLFPLPHALSTQVSFLHHPKTGTEILWVTQWYKVLQQCPLPGGPSPAHWAPPSGGEGHSSPEQSWCAGQHQPEVRHRVRVCIHENGKDQSLENRGPHAERKDQSGKREDLACTWAPGNCGSQKRKPPEVSGPREQAARSLRATLEHNRHL